MATDNNAGFNGPLHEAVIEKTYSGNADAYSDVQKNTVIPEPTYTPPPVQTNGSSVTSDPKKAAYKKPEPFNETMSELPPKEQKAATKRAAEMIVDGYAFLHIFANRQLSFSERKINKLQISGEVDLNIQIPYTPGKTMSAKEYIDEFNNQQQDVLTVSQEFREEVSPVLQRVLDKRGMGASDEQQLLYIFAKDLVHKGMIFIGMKRMMKEMVNSLQEQTAAIRATGYYNNAGNQMRDQQSGNNAGTEPGPNTDDMGENVAPIYYPDEQYIEPEEKVDDAFKGVNDIVNQMTNPGGIVGADISNPAADNLAHSAVEVVKRTRGRRPGKGTHEKKSKS